MFTWICPQCGREVPPAYTECPDCAKKAAQAPPPAQAAATPPPQTAAAPPPPEYTPPQHAPSEPYYQPPPPAPQTPAPPPSQPLLGQVQVHPYMAPPAAPRAALPTWLMTIVFALAFLGLGAGIYWTVGYFRGRSAPPVTVESPAAKAGAKTNPYQKYIEIAGVRFTSVKNKPVVKFIVINHSGADIQGLAANVTVWGRTQKSEEDAAGSFSFTTNLGPFESKDLSAPLDTKKQMVELPDWQNISTDVQVTAPAAY